MGRRDLDAAGIADPRLRASYEACRRLNAAHGRTYYLATLLLPPWKRPYVHALYGFARWADEIVDDLGSPRSPAERERRLGELTDRFRSGAADGPVLPALRDTIRRWDLPLAHFDAFLASMRMDLTVTGYPTYADLLRYVEGSAAVIGLQMVPILEPLDAAAAASRARELGIAFQLSNFIRDVGEDLRRGRLYLPAEDLAAHGVERAELAAGVLDERVRRLLAFEIERTREVYRSAAPGIDLLHPTSRDCIRTAFTLYGGILDEVERSGYRVLDRRVSVPLRRRAAVALPALARARRCRRASDRGAAEPASGAAAPTRPTTRASA
ncbi:MAG: phytoene/squalene synthase family protein [Frankiaceae bacterium]